MLTHIESMYPADSRPTALLAAHAEQPQRPADPSPLPAALARLGLSVSDFAPRPC